MEVITISSDSETSCNENIESKNFSPPRLKDEGTENYHFDWNDDVHPAINCRFEPVEKKGAQKSDLEKESKSTTTPIKLHQANLSIDYEKILYKCGVSNLKSTFSKAGISSASDSENFSQNSNFIDKSPLSKAKQRQKFSQEEREIMKIAREQKRLEREKLKEEKKAEQLKQKALKAAFLENQKNLRPEENIKFLKVHIDNDIINSACGGNIITLLQQNNIHYVVESQRKSCTVTWSKNGVKKVINDYSEVIENVEIKEENILLNVLDWKMAVELIHKNELLSYAETVKTAYTDKKLTLIIYGLGKYFSYKKNKINAGMRAEINGKKKIKSKASEHIFEEAYNISKEQLEFALTDLQLIGKYNCRLLETPEEFATLIYNFTKSLSQIDYKLDRQNRQNNDIGWVALDSSSQSVKVDKNGNGLMKLWQRQICQFSSVGLETAQAIVSHYNSPLALMNEYAKCESSKDGESLLQNIQIRRNAGIVSTSRRVGPQLSKKIYKFFTSSDPDLEL